MLGQNTAKKAYNNLNVITHKMNTNTQNAFTCAAYLMVTRNTGILLF